MRKELLLASGLAFCLALPAAAQTTDTEPQAEQTEQQQPAETMEQPAEKSGEAAGAESESGMESSSKAEGEIIPEEQDTQLRADKLMGMQVVNPEGEELGTVADIVFSQDGQVDGIVLSTGGFLGLGAKPVGVSWSDMTSAMNAEVLTIDMTSEQLAQAPEFKTKEEKQREQEAQQQEMQQQEQTPTTSE